MIWYSRADAHAYFAERQSAIDELTNVEEPTIDEVLRSNVLPEIDMSSVLGGQLFPERTIANLQSDNGGAFSLASYLAPDTISIVERPSSYVECTPEQNSANHRAVRVANTAERKVLAIKSHCDTYNSETYDMSTYQRLFEDYKSYVGGIDGSFYYCEPTISLVEMALNAYNASYDAAMASDHNAITTIYDNARRELNKLDKQFQKVAEARRKFETSSSGGSGTRAITSSHEKFRKLQERVVRFKLISFPDTPYQSGPIFDEMRKLVSNERTVSTITELDRLRNEYFEKKIPVPKPAEFTQSKGSSKFAFSELNMGSYSWAVLADALLRNIDTIASDMQSKKYPVQLNSVYRNPSHPLSSGRSQHQYGTAVDIQVFDFNSTGGVRDEEDWKLLREVTDKYSPSYTEPLAQSGPGHVHVDWRGQSTTANTYIQGDELV